MHPTQQCKKAASFIFVKSIGCIGGGGFTLYFCLDDSPIFIASRDQYKKLGQSLSATLCVIVKYSAMHLNERVPFYLVETS